VTAGLLASYAYWVSQPPSRYEAQFQEARQRQSRRPASALNLPQLEAELKSRARTFEQLKLEQLPPARLRKLQSELQGSQWKAEDYVLAYERSILDFPSQPPALNGLFALPGMAAREARLFKNDYTAQLERVRAGEDFSTLSEDAKTDWDWVCGRHGAVRTPFLKPAPDFHTEFENQRKQQAFLHLLSGILLERADTGQWPISLNEMRGYQPLPELDRKAVHYNALGDTLEVSWGDWAFTR
jgi:hypothetical protein